MQDLALAFEVDILAGPDHAKPSRWRGAIGLAHHRPDRRILRAQPPQRITSDVVGVAGFDLVEGGHSIQEPHVVAVAIVLDKGEVRIGGFRIELDIGFGIPGRKDGLLEGELLGWLPFDPIVAVTTDGNDGMVWVELFHALVEGILEPALAGDATGTTFVPVLVVAHEHDVVGDLGIGGVWPAIVVERHDQHDGKAVLGESRRHFGQEGLQILLRLRRNLLEVDGQPLKLVRLEKRNDVVESGLPRRWVREQLGQPGAVPFLIGHILNHGHDRNVGLRRLNVFEDPIIDAGFQVHGRPGKAQPAGDDPIKIGKHPLEIGVAVIVPVDVEADAQGACVRASERPWNGMAIDHLRLGMAGYQRTLLLPHLRSETGGRSGRGVRRRRDCNAMGRRAGGRPGTSDRRMRG